MSRMRYSSSGQSGPDSYHNDRHQQYDRYNPNRYGDGAGHDNGNDSDDYLPRCPCESPHKQVFTVSHLLIVHSEDLERLLAWLPMADGDVHANPGKYFEELWPTWTQECVLKQIEGPRNDHGFAFEVSAPGFPIRVRGNNSQIRQAQATAVLHFMLAWYPVGTTLRGCQSMCRTDWRHCPGSGRRPNWISGDLHEVRVQDEETEYSREYIAQKHPRLVAHFSEMQMDPTNHFSSPRKILDEFDIDFPYFTYRKLRSGFWRAYAIHRKVTVCGDALYVADARAVAILHLLVLAARGSIGSNFDSKRTYESCMRPDLGHRSRNKTLDQYKPDQSQHQQPYQNPHTRQRSRSRSPPARHSRSSTVTNHPELTRPPARSHGRSRSRSPPPPAKQARHERHSRSPWRRRRSGSRSTSRQREHERVQELPSSSPTPVSNSAPSISGSPAVVPATLPVNLTTPAALPFAVAPLPTYSTPQEAYTALVSLQSHVEQLTTSVSQAISIVQTLFAQRQQQFFQYQQQQAMLSTIAAGSPSGGLSMIPQQQQQQQQAQTPTLQSGPTFYGQSPQVHQQQQAMAHAAAQAQQAGQYQQQSVSHQAQPKSSPGLSQNQLQQQPAAMTGPGLGSSGSESASSVGASPAKHSLYGRWLN
ncbi:hypothetical protein BCR44DRAFT_1442439 [Catenaria anguillulae PL171]|uniref:Uncharacterized protein n=1 Tax=Catenaria anguillulae PL171 TaxID=765915 RepID=A0A1Y2HE35_9FUNG|nr:hypothetical protein BCR44DRAFT_1442439 [Catenaria anguillulae PL171]